MEFWIGLLVGIHAGKVIAHHLQEYLLKSGIITPEEEQILEEIEKIEEEVCK